MKADILTWLNRAAQIAVVRVNWADDPEWSHTRAKCADFIAGPDGARSLTAECVTIPPIALLLAQRKVIFS